MTDDIDSIRSQRATKEPVLPSTPEAPGILAAMALSVPLETHLRGLAHTLLVEPFRTSTLSRAEREGLAMFVSTKNQCCFCADSHAAFEEACAIREGHDADPNRQPLIHALEGIADQVRTFTPVTVTEAQAAGANDDDIHLAILIASAFSMFNRMVEGLQARTPADVSVYDESALHVADEGYLSASRKIT